VIDGRHRISPAQFNRSQLHFGQSCKGSDTQVALQSWHVNHKRVERLWRWEGLKVPQKQPQRRRLWLDSGSCIRLRLLYRHHVWSFDFVSERTSDGRPMRILNIVDEYSRECLRIHIDRLVKATDVVSEISDLFLEYGTPDYIRSDNRSEFTAEQYTMAKVASNQRADHR
jgi:putative transposase